MNDLDLAKAIKYLKPTAEFSFEFADYSTVKWILLEGDAPTMKEIEEAHQAVEQEEAQAKAQAQAKRQAAETKLAALGLTADDLKALGLGGN
jgi:hypothetical protein